MPSIVFQVSSVAHLFPFNSLLTRSAHSGWRSLEENKRVVAETIDLWNRSINFLIVV
jgi:hypothetical protein